MNPLRPLGRVEFIALQATLFATIAFSIDAMLPVLPAIAAELSPRAENGAQLVIGAFFAGMGIGTLFVGPISDALGRKATILGGLVIYFIGSVLAAVAPSLELLLAARLLQGLGAAAPRIVGLAIVRDLYVGRDMARISSLVMMIFMIVPAVAPAIGQVIANAAGWRAIYVAFMIFAVVCGSWLILRQPETLPAAARRPLHVGPVVDATREVLGDWRVRIYIIAMTLGFGQLVALLSSIQQLFGETYGRGDTFPLWFALIALLAASASVINARLVHRLGMRRISTFAFAVQTVIASMLLVLILTDALPGDLAFFAFYFWAVSIFFMAGITFGNLNALALEHMGHIAGTASSVTGAISTVLSVAIAAPIGLMFDGTPVPILIGTVFCSGASWLLMRRTGKAAG